MNVDIRCLSPNIILNKSYKVNKVYSSDGWITIIRGRVSLYVPSPKQAKITAADLDECYFFNEHSGEMIPIYIQVPCQKCILCRDKKAVDWATRITCEGNYHTNCPWWLTLTYNDYSLPTDGLVKRDLQNFLKRLRERISRVVSDDVRLRFVGVGEYGGNTARAHYHLVLYGLPSLSAKEVLHHIENAWSTRVSKKVYNQLPDDFRFIRTDCNGKPLHYQRIGFCYVKPAHDNTPLYLAKYMFKPELNTPDGKNPNFCLASRKNGIGYQYIVEYRDYHRRNPYVTSLNFKNKHTGKMCHFTIPQYFKDYFFPTPSKIIPPEVKKAYDSFADIVCCYEALKKLDLDTDMFDDVSSMVADLNHKYPFFRKIRQMAANNYIDSFRIRYRDYYSPVLNGRKKKHHWFGMDVYLDDYDELFEISFDDYIKKTRIELYSRLLMEYEYCMSLQFNLDDFIWTIKLRDHYKAAITMRMINKPPISADDAAYNLKKRYLIAKHKEYN